MSDRLRKSTKKQVISIILVLTLLLSVILSGCHGQSSEIQNKKFRKFTETLFCQEVASNNGQSALYTQRPRSVWDSGFPGYIRIF